MVMGTPFDARCCRLQVDHRIQFGLPLRDANFVAHLADRDDRALEKLALFKVGQVFDQVGRPDELRVEGSGEGHDGQRASLRRGFNIR